MHWRIGQRGVTLVAGISHVIAFTVICLHPPFTALIVAYILVGLGSGAKNGAWNTWVGGLESPNELLGLLHGVYGVGATVTPIVASTLVTKCGWQWFEVFYLFIGLALLDLGCSVTAFTHSDGTSFRHQASSDGTNVDRAFQQAGPDRMVLTDKYSWKKYAQKFTQSHAIKALRNKVVLVCAAFLLVYIGVEVAIGGWLVTFMIDIRHATPLVAGMINSGYWAGITIGRIALGFVSGRFFRSEKQAVAAYVVLAIVLQLLFWLIPSMIASAVMVALLGKFMSV